MSALEDDRTSSRRDLDPIFGLPTPTLFAHRGRAREVEESIRRGFDHAIAVGADVLELDIHGLATSPTGGRELAVSHGPELSNVIIDFGPTPEGRKRTYRPIARSASANDIRHWC